MRLHVSRGITEETVRHAAQKAGATLEHLSEHGSRKAAHAFEVHLTGASNHRPNSGNYGAGDAYAATWDQWGVFLSALYALDPDMTCWAYKDVGDFNWQTAYRFAYGRPDDMHGDHRWQSRVPYEQECTKCSAVRRFDSR